MAPVLSSPARRAVLRRARAAGLGTRCRRPWTAMCPGSGTPAALAGAPVTAHAACSATRGAYAAGPRPVHHAPQVLATVVMQVTTMVRGGVGARLGRGGGGTGRTCPHCASRVCRAPPLTPARARTAGYGTTSHDDDREWGGSGGVRRAGLELPVLSPRSRKVAELGRPPAKAKGIARHASPAPSRSPSHGSKARSSRKKGRHHHHRYAHGGRHPSAACRVRADP